MRYFPFFNPLGTVSLHRLGLPSHSEKVFWNQLPSSIVPSCSPRCPVLNQSAVDESNVWQSSLVQCAIHAIIGPTVCTQYMYTAVMFWPGRMGMYARAGVPGVLQEREALVVSKIGSLVIHFLWTIQGAASWNVWSSKGEYLFVVLVASHALGLGRGDTLGTRCRRQYSSSILRARRLEKLATRL
jgi:hypothetical protein